MSDHSVEMERIAAALAKAEAVLLRCSVPVLVPPLDNGAAKAPARARG